MARLYRGNNLIAHLDIYTDERKEEETKTQALSMASGNQVITPTTDKVMTQVTITKPSTLIPANIKSGINIGGVLGTLACAPFSNAMRLTAYNSASTTMLNGGIHIFIVPSGSTIQGSMYDEEDVLYENYSFTNNNDGDYSYIVADLNNNKTYKRTVVGGEFVWEESNTFYMSYSFTGMGYIFSF